MILFSFPGYEDIAGELRTIPAVRSGQFTVVRYDNQELHARVETAVSGARCAILGTIAPPDERLFSLALLAHTLRKEGAGEITALLPYLAYSRQDKSKPGESLGTAWVGALLKSSGIDRVLTIDVHSDRDKQLFPIPLISSPAVTVFANAIRMYGLEDATVVAPDNGAIRRCEAVKKAAGLPTGPTPHFEKRRTDEGILHYGPIGTVGTKAVIIDDMIDTGGTLVSACGRLREIGVREMDIFVTHGLFTGSSWLELWSLGVRRIFCTDTVPLRSDLDRRNIIVLPIAPVLRETFLARELRGNSQPE